jgi:hypothetical protein
MQEWGMNKAPRRLRASVQKVLSELRPEALLYLKNPKLEVKIIHKPDYSVWAYFPFHRRRLIDRELHLRSGTRVLLVFSNASSVELPRKIVQDQIRDQLGHVLLYLRSPYAWNDCSQAMKEMARELSRATEGKKGAASKERTGNVRKAANVN